MAVLDCVGSGSRIAIIRLRSLGDCILTTPAIALLKQHRPDLKIGVVVEDRFAEVYHGNPDIDTVLSPEAGAIHSWKPALTLNLHGGTRSLKLMVASRAYWRVAFGHFPFSLLYNVRIPRAQEIFGVERTVHTAEQVASAMFFLGVPQTDIPRAKLFAARPSRQPGNYAILHPKASTPEKTWPAAHFCTVAEHLIQQCGIEPVFIAAPGERLDEFSGFRQVNDASLEQIKGLMAGASLFIGNDSGPAHMAAAFGLPVIVLFGPSNPQIWAPWRTQSEVMVSPANICGITPQRVTAALDRVRFGAAV